MKYILIILIPSLVYAQTEIDDAKKSIMALIKPLLASSSKGTKPAIGKFRVDGCEKTNVDWMGILLMQKTTTLDFKFKEGCDIEGSITPKVLQAFAANLNLRNLESYSKIQTMNRVTANLETKPILNLNMRQGVLSGKKSLIKFEADYQVQINPTEDKAVQKNLGGELRISEINGKQVKIKERIFID